MKATLFILAVFLANVFISCISGTKKENTPEGNIVIKHDSVKIAYDDTKTGDTTLVFIHGWGINRTYWKDQILFFSKKYRVVTVDLPGFGESGKNRSSWTMEDYGGDVSEVLKQLDLNNVILIGHSMSGAVVTEAALNNAPRVIGVIGVDNFKDIDMVFTPEVEKEWGSFYEAVRRNFKKTMSEDMLPYLFTSQTDSLVRKRVSADILSADTTVAVNCLVSADKYPFSEKLTGFLRPVYLVNSDAFPTDTLAFKKLKVDYGVFNMGPTGHYPMIEKPEVFNKLLQKAIDRIGKINPGTSSR